DELAGLVAAGRGVGPGHDVVEPELEDGQQILAGDAALLRGLGVQVAELLLHEPVDAARLLLLAQLEQVLAVADAAAAVLAGRVGLALHRALHRVALLALEEQLHPLTAAEAADRAGQLTRHLTPSGASEGGTRCAGSG